jgi:NAD(P)-dependent dehydrogenase (short-subunit alcohol dehydrogenase family)
MRPESAKPLAERVAVVAGASRGCGRGVALALGEAGATVYVTGRTVRGGTLPVDRAPGTIDETAEEVTRRGGVGVPVQLDHTDPAQVRGLFRGVQEDHGRLDVLVSAVWGGNERFLDPQWSRPFWEQPLDAWRDYMEAGPYAFWLAAHEAAGVMTLRRSGLIVAISEPVLENAFEGQMPAMAETFSRLAHFSLNDLVRGLSVDARPAGISVIGLLPGFMKTERVEMHLRSLGEEARQRFRYDLAETPEYAGRAVVALATDAHASARSGQLLYVADLAEACGFNDVGGTRVGNFYRLLGMVP